MTHLSLEEYREMISNILDFKNEHDKMPEFVEINEIRINQTQYYDMIERFNRFYLQMGRNPRSISII
jgi:hypothetical protein